MESRLRQIAGKLLARPDAICFIGYEAAPGSTGRTRPAIIRAPSQVDRLVWNQRCHANLTVYLPRYKGTAGIIGIAVKGCDARSLRELLRAGQVDRQRLMVVGIPCAGLVHPDGRSLASRCHGCQYPEDLEYDETLGPMRSPDLPAVSPAVEELAGLAGMDTKERQRFWLAEIEKCIRCDACRRICYACFCPRCIFESSRPRWIGRRGDRAERLFFHAVRAYHLAGRCIGCDECARICPAGVRLDLLNRSLRAYLREIFSFSGVGLTAVDPPLLAFLTDDPDPGRAARDEGSGHAG